MSLEEAHGRIIARVWRAIAKSGIDVSAIPEAQLEALVEIVTDAALIEIDKEIAGELPKEKLPEVGSYLDEGDEREEVLWSGRPFLSFVTEFIITNERVRLITGILGKDREDIELIRIQDIDQSQTFGDRILQIGDIIVHSHDRSDPDVVLYNVREPETVHEILRRAVLDARKKHGLIFREEM